MVNQLPVPRLMGLNGSGLSAPDNGSMLKALTVFEPPLMAKRRWLLRSIARRSLTVLVEPLPPVGKGEPGNGTSTCVSSTSENPKILLPAALSFSTYTNSDTGGRYAIPARTPMGLSAKSGNEVGAPSIPVAGSIGTIVTPSVPSLPTYKKVPL